MSSMTICSFPDHVRKWVHPGMDVLIKDQTQLDCYNKRFQNEVLSLLQKEKIAILKNDQNRFQGTSEELQSRVFRTAHSILHPTMEETVGIPNAEEVLLYNQTLDYIEANVLPRSLKTASNLALQNLIKRLHFTLLSPNHPNFNWNPKYYRTCDVLINRVKGVVITKLDTLRASVIKNSPNELPLLKEFLEHCSKYNNPLVSEIRNAVSAETAQFIDKYCEIAPPADKVPLLMEEFIDQLLLRLNKNDDSISIASFVHQQLIKIHPYSDGNGRLARILMNVVLMQAGHQPIAFAFDHEYSKALQDEQTGVTGSFEKLIRFKVAQFDYEALPINLLSAITNLQKSMSLGKIEGVDSTYVLESSSQEEKKIRENEQTRK